MSQSLLHSLSPNNILFCFIKQKYKVNCRCLSCKALHDLLTLLKKSDFCKCICTNYLLDEYTKNIKNQTFQRAVKSLMYGTKRIFPYFVSFPISNLHNLIFIFVDFRAIILNLINEEIMVHGIRIKMCYSCKCSTKDREIIYYTYKYIQIPYICKILILKTL